MTNKGKILVVDDTPASLKLLTDLLKTEGYEVRPAISGELALKAASGEPPELIVLDIRMPEMDGFEVCRRLKAQPETINVPVIFVSAASEAEEKAQGFALGAVDYVTKPYQRDELLARVRTHIELYRLRNHLESLIEERTAKLAQSNADLEHFAYSVSHDMRQPLRAISGHLQLLQLSLHDKMDEADRVNFDFALDGAKRMDSMIVSLLEYSRIGRKTEAKKLIASRDSLETALNFLEPAIQQSGANIKVSGEWPQVVASRDELIRLFQNLIGNALHYREPGIPPKIEITSTTEKVWRVSVRDYGIGIDPQQISRLFNFFIRLHSREQFDGTGMGLALCRRIVEHHDGRIWVESEGAGKGSTFIFELPLDSQTRELLAH